MDDGGSVSTGRLLLDDVDELKGAAEGRVRGGPLRTAEVTDLQHIVVL